MTQGAKEPDVRASSSHGRWRPTMGVPALTLWVALFIVAVDNIAFWQQLAGVSQVGQISGWRFTVATAVFLLAALSALMSVWAFRFIYKPFLIGLLLVAAVVGYFMQTYGVVVDDTMITNTLDTDHAEAAGLLNPVLGWHILWAGILPSIAVLWVRLRRRGFIGQALIRVGFTGVMLLIAVAAIGVQYKQFSLTLRQHRELRLYINPTYAIYSAFEVAQGQARAADQPLVVIGQDATRTAAAKAGNRRKVMIMVVGETTRATDWGLNGYSRQTTPELARLNVLNFPDAHACGTSTAVSVPCMFSAKPRRDFDIDSASYTENLLDVLQRAGVDVRWEDNQAGGCKGVCDRVPTQNMRTLRIPGVCGKGHCLDGVFLHGLADRINNTHGDLLLVMHIMGSHGPAYYRRYPPAFKVYKPICESSRPQQCSRQELVNSFDNTVRYLDHNLAAMIGLLKHQVPNADTALFYLADHGESLGEHGIYLHGFPYRFAPGVQTHISETVWLSPGFMQSNDLSPACLARQANERVSQDAIFSTVMAMMDVKSGLYNRQLDMFAPCRSDAARQPESMSTSR